MPRRRQTQTHLPQHVYFKHGAYYFVDRAKKWHWLGKSEGDMHRAMATLADVGEVGTIAQLIERYKKEVLSGYRKHEQTARRKHLERIGLVMGTMAPPDLTGLDVRQFRDKLGQRKGNDWGKPQLALKALMVLSHMFSWACEWGLVETNPCIGVKRPPQPRRTRYPSDAEFEAVKKWCPPMFQVAMDIALFTGLRREDLLAIDRDACTDEGLIVNTGKTGKALQIAVKNKDGTPNELAAAIDRGWKLPPRVRRHLICTHEGEQYTPDGFSANWKRYRDKAIEKKDLATPYRFNDIRAKSASDDADGARASNRLGHTSRAVTEKFYIRKPRKVESLR